MIVTSSIDEDVPTPKECSDGFERFEAFRTLRHDEFWEDLEAEFRRRVAEAAHGEASFSIDESDDPLRMRSFLLIVCTVRCVTWHDCSLRNNCTIVATDAPDVSAFSRMFIDDGACRQAATCFTFASSPQPSQSFSGP